MHTLSINIISSKMYMCISTSWGIQEWTETQHKRVVFLESDGFWIHILLFSYIETQAKKINSFDSFPEVSRQFSILQVHTIKVF